MRDFAFPRPKEMLKAGISVPVSFVSASFFRAEKSGARFGISFSPV